MRNFAWVSISLFLMLASAVLPAQAEDGAIDTRTSDVDSKLREWCASHFPKDEGESAKPAPRPVEKLRPFEFAQALTPPGLVTRTEIIGTLPPEIEKYKGQWTWPAHDKAPAATLFVERLTATEMAIAWVLKREKHVNEANHPDLRTMLKWTGSSFSYSKSISEGSATLDIYVSANSEAMAVVTGYSRLVTLGDRTGKQSSYTSSEAFPACFISSKHY